MINPQLFDDAAEQRLSNAAGITLAIVIGVWILIGIGIAIGWAVWS